MKHDVRRVTEITDSVFEAFERLLPQLSPHLADPCLEWLQSVVASPTSALFAVWNGDVIAGMLTIAWYDVPSGSKGWIEDVVVDVSIRGTGAGEALVHAALEYAARIGIEKVMLTSSPAREAAHALYRKTGFEEQKTVVFACKIEDIE